jgi:hypothetical protein
MITRDLLQNALLLPDNHLSGSSAQLASDAGDGAAAEQVAREDDGDWV